ncbi:MAG: fumarylacetoacetate hydrolase family protein [Candidatus Altiarchaeota archaeon]|nr:fumarylacetoacetate hydrolase family protein [Candidatus Altiarchaeota archaeon]
MKLVRFESYGGEKLGILDDAGVKEITGDIFNPGRETGGIYNMEEIIFHPPVYPEKIVCVGFNYRAHMGELKEIATKKPTITLKARNSILAHEQAIILPKNSNQVEHEAELGIVIKKEGYRIIKPEEHILGYTIVNDVTARDIEKEMIQWSASKSFPTFCPVGPCIETDVDPSDLQITCKVNGELRQNAKTSLMIYKPEKLVSFVSQFMRLERGDLIATGTVPGVGPLVEGDVVEIEIEDISVLRNYVKLE